MRHHLATSIEIAASPEQVWDVLTDLPAYPEWNPFITSAAGTVAEGERLTLRMQPPGGRAMTFRPTVTEVDRHATWEWLGHTVLPGVFDGRHRFTLEPTESGTLLHHGEDFRGLLVRPLRSSLDAATAAGFHRMNESLKERVEAAAASAPA